MAMPEDDDEGGSRAAEPSARDEAGDAWDYYWRRFHRRFAGAPQANLPDYIDREFGGSDRPVQILALGGDSGWQALDLARRLQSPYRIEWIDRNTGVFDQLAEPIRREDRAIRFRRADLDFVHVEPRRYDVIVMHTALWQVGDYGRLFEQIAGGLGPRGLFHLVEVAARSRAPHRDGSETLANALLNALPASVTGGQRLALRHAEDAEEGARQEDLLPLLHRIFAAEVEEEHGAFMRFICADPSLRACFDPANPAARGALDFLIDCDDAATRNGVLQPREIWGLYRAKPV